MHSQLKSFTPPSVFRGDIEHALFENLNAGLAVIDLRGTILQVNPALQRILQVPDAKLLGASLDVLCGTDSEREHIWRMFRSSIGEQRHSAQITIHNARSQNSEDCFRLTFSTMGAKHQPELVVAQLEPADRGVREDNSAELRNKLSIVSHALQSLNSDFSISPSSVMRTLVKWAVDSVRGEVGFYGLASAGYVEFSECLLSGQWMQLERDRIRRIRVDECEETYAIHEHDGREQVSQWMRKHFGTQSLVNVPVFSGTGELLGAVQIGSGRQAFSRTDIKLLQGLAASAAVAMENARLHEITYAEIDRRDNALRASEDRFIQAREAAKIGSFDWNLKTDELSWWAEVPSLRGMSIDGTATSWSQRLHPDDREGVGHMVAEAVQLGKDFDFDCRLRDRDGETIWIRSIGHPLHTLDGTIHYVGIAIDISSRKLTEEALMNSEKLATVGRMAATIAHEINNPMEAVLNLVYLARVSATKDDVQKFLIAAEHEIARISHITRQTLGFYHDTTQPTQLDLSELVEETVNLYRSKLPKKNIDLRLRLQRPLLFDGLGGELKQVVANLLTNAIDASSPDSTITLRTRSRGDRVQLTVSDSGSGIPAKIRTQVFTPFFTTKTNVGTGLGLWVTRGIVEKHHGTINLRSRVGQKSGTVFVVKLPRNMPSPAR